eukprot:6484675-Amphidinium_carterae.1
MAPIPVFGLYSCIYLPFMLSPMSLYPASSFEKHSQRVFSLILSMFGSRKLGDPVPSATTQLARDPI